MEIAVEEIVTLLQLPTGAACTVVSDSAYCAADVVSDICEQGYDVVTRLPSDRRVQPPDGFGKRRVDTLAESVELQEVSVTVRGEEQEYLAAAMRVFLPFVGGVKLVITGVEEQRRYHIRTNLDLSVVEILCHAENNWNIDIIRQESNAKFGFDQYELEEKQAIERFLQLGFVAWAIVTLAEERSDRCTEDQSGSGAHLGQAKIAYLVETLLLIGEQLDSSLPSGATRTAV